MEEDDHDELLQCTDDESLSESEEQCLPVDKYEENQRKNQKYTTHSTFEFLFVKVLLILSSTLLMMLLPLYLETVNVKSDSYSLLYFVPLFTAVLLGSGTGLCRLVCPKFVSFSLFKSPLKWFPMWKITILYTLSGFMVVYALDRKRVMCHLQDPIKGIVLVFSLVYYFFFCRKLMGLQRIFSTTTIIVGLFISVDYGLCDEFRCRGFEREHRSDDAGHWNWQIHSLWAGIYIFGLAVFAAYYTLLDRYLVPVEMFSEVTASTAFLTTVSRLVSYQSSNGQAAPETIPLNNIHINEKQHSVVHLAFWIHLQSFLLTLALFWTDVIPTIGKGANMGQFLNNTMNGLICHFTITTGDFKTNPGCANLSLYAWLFLFIYIIFVLSSLQFLIWSQSAVYTIATSTTALPLLGIWWSLFQVTSIDKGLLKWSPSVTGELICALLGLPIVLIGLTLLCKSHFKDFRLARANLQAVSNTNFA